MDYYSGNLPAETITANDDVISDDLQKSRNIKVNRGVLLLAVLFLFGILLGAIYIAGADSAILNTLDYFLFSSIETRMTHHFFPIFTASAASSFLFLLCAFLGGLTMWGSFFVPILLFLRGFGVGMTAGYVYSFGGLGFLYQILIVLPGILFSCFAIMLVSKEAISFSRRLNFAHRMRQSPQVYVKQPSVKNYAMRTGVLSCLALIGSLLDVLTALIFSGIFQDHIF